MSSFLCHSHVWAQTSMIQWASHQPRPKGRLLTNMAVGASSHAASCIIKRDIPSLISKQHQLSLSLDFLHKTRIKNPCILNTRSREYKLHKINKKWKIKHHFTRTPYLIMWFTRSGLYQLLQFLWRWWILNNTPVEISYTTRYIVTFTNLKNVQKYFLITKPL